MRVLRACLGFTATLLLAQSALARDLKIATVTPQGVACVFTPACAVSVTDTIGYFRLFGNSGSGKLLVRTYPGVAGTQAAGLTGYSLYIDMRGSTALGMANCAERLTLDTGPVAPLKYTAGAAAEVFVVGVPGGIGLSSASQNGSKLSFRFTRPVCPGRDSLYFGFASRNAPMSSKGQVSGSLEGNAEVEARVPKH